MSRLGTMGRIGVLALAASACGLLLILALRSKPKSPDMPQPSKEVSARLKLQGALRDASILDLIQNARVAARKGDDRTHRAMVSGLKRDPVRAKTLVQGEITKTKDSEDISILNRIISELP